MDRRVERVSVLLREKLSEIIAQDMKDPRLVPLISIVRVGLSRDLRHARVFTSVLGDADQSESAVGALNAAAGYLRKELTARLSLRSIPSLNFVVDESIKEGAYLLDRIEEVRSKDSEEGDWE
jgi:ribosome-binding factor A